MFDFVSILSDSLAVGLFQWLYGSFLFLGVMCLTKKVIF